MIGKKLGAKGVFNDARDSGFGGNGGGDPPAPRASVALSAKQWSAVLFAISHGVRHIQSAKDIPVRIISEALKDLGDATAEIQKRLENESVRRGEKDV